jgi:serine/threonine-protein kinase
MADAATALFDAISTALRTAVVNYAPAAILTEQMAGGWTLRMNHAELRVESLRPVGTQAAAPFPFDVIAHSSVAVSAPHDAHGYVGRRHSLWYGDVQVAGEYGWFETAFMNMPLMGGQPYVNPFAHGPGREALEAIRPGVGALQVAWPFTRLEVGALEDFIGRWAGWFADGANGQLHHPGTMPERDPSGSWRQS